MDERIVGEIKLRAQRAIKEKVFSGCVIGLIRPNKTIVISVGTTDGSVPVVENTVYDVASITKSIPTASLALMFIDQGKLSLGDLVRNHIPELQNDYDATVEDLLMYRVRGPRMSQLADKTSDEIIEYVFAHGFDVVEGEPHYANLPAFLLGLILERVGGATLSELAQRYFFDPLKMTDTTFFPAPLTSSKTRSNPIKPMRPHRFDGILSRIAPTEIVDGREIRGIVHDESARVFARSRRAVGHAGLFSTVPDLLKFLEAPLLNKKGFTKPLSDGALDNEKGFRKPLFSALVEGAQKGLGWEVNREWMGRYRNEKTFGKTGFTGTSVVVDIERGIGFVILSNRTYPHRPADNSDINLFRIDIADIVFG
ncbi:MAG TPA: serine hydrolase domain-containing protein [Candidatus Paceibacterota bacterium]